jgi:RHS repeat-associated protein
MARSAAFDGNARVEIQDPAGELSWMRATNALTVECWFRISVPSGQSISDNMTILANSTDPGSTNYAYLVHYNAFSGDIEFQVRAGNVSNRFAIISRPYLDRWYHVAVRRSVSNLWALVDGREVVSSQTPNLTVGNGSTNRAVSIGGWGNGKYFRGDIQEVRIYQQDVGTPLIGTRMFADLVPSSYPRLRGYYKLGYSTNSADQYRNFSAYAPSNTDPAVKQGAGSIAFEEVDQGGEQSLFDSRKNNGESAIVPLSGAFTFQQPVLTRPTRGIPMALRIGYSSANAYTAAKLGEKDLLEDKPMGRGWRHSFQMRLVYKGIATERHLVRWDGSIETWIGNPAAGIYTTRHGEYRGELTRLPDWNYEWKTPDHVRYRFFNPESADHVEGRLFEIEDMNGNAIRIAYDPDGRVSQVEDTVGGQYLFGYDGPGHLTSIRFNDWLASFEYANDLLVAHSVSGPPGYATATNRWEYLYNANGLLWRIKDPRGNYQTEVGYDAYGRRTSLSNALGRTTWFEYDRPARRQIQMTDAGGRRWVDTFDRKGRMLAHADPLNATALFAYDAGGNVISRTEPLGWKTTYAYDLRSNLIAETNALGLVRRWVIHPTYNKPVEAIDQLNWSTYFAYDAAGNLLTNYDGLGVLALNTYYTNGLLKTSADGNGHATSFSYTPEGFLETKTDPATNTWRYGHNELGWPLAITNPLDQVVTFTYDVNGRQLTMTDPLRTFSKSYDANGNVLAESDAKGAVTRYVYDAANQRTQMVDRASNSWAYTYTSRGALETSTDPLTNSLTRTYDDVNRLIRVTDPLGNVERMEYDDNGNTVATVDKLDRRYTRSYDRLNRVVAETDPLGNTRATTYDAAGRIKTIKLPKGYTSTHDYDNRGRLIRWLDPENLKWEYAYDGVANITNITDAMDGHYVMAYGLMNERIMERNQDSITWRYGYDKLLRLNQQTDPNGTTRNIVYDDVGRIDLVWFSTGRSDNYQYNDTSDNVYGLSRNMPPPASSTDCAFKYDSMDRVIEYTGPFPINNTVKYAYDAAGRLAVVVYPENKIVTNRFDSLGRLQKQTDWASRELAYTWDKANRMGSRQYPNGVTQTNTYDAAGRLTGLSYLGTGGNALIALEYAFDRNGNKVSHLEQGTLRWSMPARIDEQANFTASGRLVDSTDAFNPANAFTYAYDAAGNMTSAVSAVESYALTYDEDNRALSITWRTNGIARTIQNRYDALGRRVSKKDNGVETRYVLDPSGRMERILCDMNGSSQITAWYVHGPDLSYRVDSGGILSVYLADAQANVIAVADATTNLVTKYAYTPYGRLLGVSGVQTDPFRFVGSHGVMQDLPGLYFMRARYYSANAAMFVSVDPVRNIGPTWRPSAYGYASGNPNSLSDPKGENPLLVYTFFNAAYVGYTYGWDQVNTPLIAAKHGAKEALVQQWTAEFGKKTAKAGGNVIGGAFLAYDELPRMNAAFDTGLTGADGFYENPTGHSLLGDIAYEMGVVSGEMRAHNQAIRDVGYYTEGPNLWRTYAAVNGGHSWDLDPNEVEKMLSDAVLSERAADAARQAALLNPVQAAPSSAGGRGGGRYRPPDWTKYPKLPKGVYVHDNGDMYVNIDVINGKGR